MLSQFLTRLISKCQLPIFTFLSAIFLFSGCGIFIHSIHPVKEADPALLQSVEPSAIPVAIVLDEHLKDFRSKDRGHPVADPQQYFVGEAVVALSETYFRRAFPTSSFYNSMTEKTDGAETYKIYLRILFFDNELQFGNGQTISLQYKADIYDKKNIKYSEVTSRGKEQGPLGLFSFNKKSAKITSRAIQKGLIHLIENLQNTLPK